MTTTIRREKHRPLWQRAWQRRWVPVALVILALAGAVLVTAWRMGGPVPVKPVAVTLPSTTVGSPAAQGAQGAVSSGPAAQGAASSGRNGR